VRIAQLANFYTPTSGGLRTCLDELGRGYVAAGHERVLIVPGRADLDEPTPSGRRITIASPRLVGSGSYHVLTNRRRVLALLDDLRPDVFEVSDKLSLGWLAPWARRRGVRLVLFSHERIDAILRPLIPTWLPLRFAADAVNRRLARLADTVVVASCFAAAEFNRVGAANVRRVPLGVDLSTFRPRPSQPDPVTRLVLLSRLSREKRPERAIDALCVLAAQRPVELTVIGNGPQRRHLERRAAGLPVRFLGHLAARDAIARTVGAADIALCPSPAETFGLATLEAMACGTPVVVPAAGAARELVAEPGSGAICDGTPAGLAAGVRELLNLPADVRRRAARASAERFPWSATVSAMLDEYLGVGAATPRA
jgi:alpha-1,6-mannosyltransferase